jgi:cbb3-type cytochrome oxidase subunit 1
MISVSAGRTLWSSGVGFRWFRVAVIYFGIAVLLGVGMGATGNLAFYSVHAHLNLLGWESLALMGLIYECLPDAGRNRMATTHFWMHNIALPVMMLALVAKGLGDTRVEPVLAVSSIAVAAAVVVFAGNVLVAGAREVRGPVSDL